jgi:hypothetical protein
VPRVERLDGFLPDRPMLVVEPGEGGRRRKRREQNRSHADGRRSSHFASAKSAPRVAGGANADANPRSVRLASCGRSQDPDCASVLTFLRDNAATNAGHGTIRVDSKKSEPRPIRIAPKSYSSARARRSRRTKLPRDGDSAR